MRQMSNTTHLCVCVSLCGVECGKEALLVRESSKGHILLSFLPTYSNFFLSLSSLFFRLSFCDRGCQRNGHVTPSVQVFTFL